MADFNLINVLCWVGVIYFVWRIVSLLKFLLWSIFKPKVAGSRSTKEKIADLCHCDVTNLADFD